MVVREVDAELAEAGRDRIAASLDRAAHLRQAVRREDRDAALERLRITTDLDDLADRDLVIEAVVEDEPTKTAVFRDARQGRRGPGRAAGHQHLLHPDHEAGRGHRAARSR